MINALKNEMKERIGKLVLREIFINKKSCTESELKKAIDNFNTDGRINVSNEEVLIYLKEKKIINNIFGDVYKLDHYKIRNI